MMNKTISPGTSGADIYPVSEYEMRVLRAIRRIFRAVDMHSRNLQRAKQITTPQLVTLIAMVRRGPMTLTMLNQSFDLGVNTAADIIDQLEAKGLVRRLHDTSGRRQRQEVIAVTEAGEQLAHDAPLPLQSRLLEGFRALPEEEQSIIALELEKLVRLIGASDISASAILDPAPITRSSHTPHHANRRGDTP
jgi:DNA-binding MarR family transcriptional regulator